jgi:flagellar protein FlgJ
MATITPAGLAADAKSLESLKQQAKASPQQATRQAALQFEAMFMNMLMKSMREALPNSDPLASSASKMYTGMLDSELAQKLAGKGLGLADVMVRQLERKSASPAAGSAATPAAAAATAAPAITRKSVSPAATTPPAGSAPAVSMSPTRVQQDFVSRMQAPARAAARESGIPEHFILGQAALESGWGRREIRGADGTTSHNLFGIKAGRNWTGPTVETMTTEYVNGAPKKVVEKFRAYGSYAEAFSDYARLLGNSSRYASAVRSGGDANLFANRIQAAGYATDPGYAGKLARVIHQARQIQTTV